MVLLECGVLMLTLSIGSQHVSVTVGPGSRGRRWPRAVMVVKVDLQAGDFIDKWCSSLYNTSQSFGHTFSFFFFKIFF